VLGAILLDNSSLRKVSALIGAGDFYRTAHAEIFRAMQALADGGAPIDNITVCDCLEQAGKLQAVGGRAYIAELLTATPSAVNVESHARIVREKSVLRRLRRESMRAIDLIDRGSRLEDVASALQGSVRTEEPEPAPPGDPWPTLDSRASHGLAGEVVRLIEPHTEADSVALLVSFLAEVGCMLGRAPHLILDGAYHPLLVWPVLVGRSSKSRKGSAAKRMQAVLSLADPDWTRGQYRGTLSSGEGLAYAVRDPQYQDVPLKERGRPTGETVRTCIDPGIEDKRLFLVQAEFGAVLRVMSRDGNSLSGVLRDAWDGQDLAPMTKSNRVRATGPHIGIVGHVTDDELLRNLDCTEASNGFGNRFLWLLVRRSKELPFPSEPDSVAMDRLARDLRRAIQRGRTIGRLGMTDAARDDWGAIYHDLSADRPGLVGALTARSEAQVMRLSAIYAVLDGRTEIDHAHLMAGLALWEFSEASVRMIFGDATGDPVADAVLRAVRASGELSDSQISDLFGRNVQAGRLTRAKASLVAAGLLHSVSVETGGRPRSMWRPTKKTN
jgi:hypothetical protein